MKIVKESYDLDKYELIEEELFRKGEGYCFGEWALIYKQPRAASVYTLEDCVFFTLDEKYFKKSFLNSLEISEFNKKKFALENFFHFNMVNEKLSSLYKNCIPISCKKNQVIFNEGEKSDSIYLVYLGSFTLVKKFGYKLFNILNLEKGSIVGLESIFGYNQNKYKCSLRLSNGSNFGLIFQLKINKLKPHLINQMKIGFKEHYDLFMNSWKELFKTNTFVREFLLNKLQEENIKEGNKELLLDYINDYEIYDSLLKFQKVDKYEALFKKCNKSNDYEYEYENRKKDGSLRIFSSKQKNRVYDEEDEKNKIQHNINIIKYFKQSPKKNINHDRENLKSASPLRIRKLTSLNNNETSNSNKKTKRECIYDLFSTSEKNNEINYKYSKTENKIDVNFKEKNNKINNEIIPKQLKFNFRNNDSNRLNQNNRYNKTKSKKEIIEFFDNNKQNKNNNKISINKKDFLKGKIKNFINFRKEIDFKTDKILKNSKISIIKQNLSNKSIIKRSESLRILNNINPLTKTNKENKNNKISLINNFESSSTRSSNKKLFRLNMSSAKNNKVRNKILFRDNNNISKIKLKKSASLKQFNYLTPKEDKIIQYLDKVRNKGTNISDEYTKDKYIINNKIKSLSTKYADIYKECNLNNGFSVSYFKKIKENNEFNKFEIVEYNSKYPLSPNKFKIAFNSGDFNIPLVSSSISFKRSYRK